MGKLISIIGAWLTKKLLWDVALKALAFVYFFSLTAMATSFFYMLDFFIQKIRLLSSTIQHYQGNSVIVSNFYSALNLSGVTQAFNDTSLLISAALVFLISRILIVNVNKFYKYYYDLLKEETSNRNYIG